MAFTTPAFVPSTGLKDTSTFVTTPASETAARKQIQDVLDQALAAIQTLIDELETETSGSSGGELVHTKAIAGVTGTTVGAQLADLKSQIDGVTAGAVSDASITTAKLAADAVDGTKIADDSIDSEHYVALSIDTEHLSADCVTGAKIADDTIDSEHYAAGSIDAEHLASSSVEEAKIKAGAVTITKLGADCVNGTKIADDSIDSEHYVAGSIDEEHLAAGCVTQAKLASTTYTTPNSLWTGTWTTGTITLDVSAYTFFMIVTDYAVIPAFKFTQSGVTKIEGVGYYGYSGTTAVSQLAIDISVSGTTLTKNVLGLVSLSNGSTTSVSDVIASNAITAIYGIA